MKIILHGATNWNSSNFGDFIYGNEIYEYMVSCYGKNSVKYYQPSKYFIRYTKNYETKGRPSIRKADLLVYFPGGYFGEGHNARLVDSLIQSYRFMPFGLYGVFWRKKILILGIGAGPITHFSMKWPIKIICKNSSLITTRDVVSSEALKRIGFFNARNHGDMILAYNLYDRAVKSKQTEAIMEESKGRRILLIHYNHSTEALRKFADVVNVFSNNHNNYYFVVSSDSVLRYEIEYYEKFNSLVNTSTYHFIYNDPFEMIQLIKMADTILTCKLHVGVVAAMFGNSVICAAEHPEKTQRFYKQIGYDDRCVSLYDVDSIELYNILERYHDIPIHIPSKIIDEAKKHWEELKEAIRDEK